MQVLRWPVELEPRTLTGSRTGPGGQPPASPPDPRRGRRLARTLAGATVASMKSRRLMVWLTAAAALAAAPACGGSSTDQGRIQGGADAGAVGAGACTPGATRVCVGPAACQGGQLCAADGHWGGCDCGGGVGGSGAAGVGGRGAGGAGPGGRGQGGSGGIRSAGSGGATASSGGGGGAAGGSRFGRPCRADPDCGGGGVVCLTSGSSDLAGEGPANGLCVVDCAAGGPAACAPIDPNALCVAFSGGAAYCMEPCTVGPVPRGGDKCHGRLDVACDDGSGTAPGDGFCRPLCRGDFDCAGRRCDLASGFCGDPGTVGALPIGSVCDPQSATEPCSGSCSPVGGTSASSGTCQGLCSLGGPGCGAAPGSSAPASVACLFDGTAAGAGDVGDIGLCAALCDCDSDCQLVTRVCRPFSSAALRAGYGRAGYCTDAVSRSGAPVPHAPCADAGPAGG
jgi:hypothetical protein